jgi:uncharacterized heparinase superfamily protein
MRSAEERTLGTVAESKLTLSMRVHQEVDLLVREAVELGKDRFECLGQVVDLSEGIGWNSTELSQLWRYHLHYFGYVRSLVIAMQVTGDKAHFSCFQKIVWAWKNENYRLIGDGWHPYTLSLRIVNWLQAAAVWREEIEKDSEFRAMFFGSLYTQVRMLRLQVEFDVRGNHILENLRALLWAGTAFEGAEAEEWRRFSLVFLEKETGEQILADGGHFERTPGYHAAVMRDLLEIGLLLERNERSVPAWLRAAVCRQAHFLRDLLGPNGRLPLLKDTAYDAAPDPQELLTIAAGWLGDSTLKPARAPGLETVLLFGWGKAEVISSWKPCAPADRANEWRATGFLSARTVKGEHWILDVGRPCPDYLPAHAHADSLNYEYHFSGRPVVVDSGVYEYKAGPWRDYFRSTRAHNTVEVAGGDSSEVWGSFRVGRKARVAVKHAHLREEVAYVLTCHDGYRHLAGRPVHQRAFLWSAEHYLLVVDRVTSTTPHEIKSYLHLYPSIRPEWSEPGRRRAKLVGVELWLHLVSASSVEEIRGAASPLPQGWYSERFGQKVSNSVLSLQPTAEHSDCVVYAFSPYQDFKCRLSKRDGNTEIAITIEGQQEVFQISQHTVSKR